jgi:UDPglucose--hexose-1-phosphate uridylyltransferase
MDTPAIRHVVEMWIAEYQKLAAYPWMGYVQIFENRGAMMGASNPHPHCQIWATESVPGEPLREQESFASHLTKTGKCLLCEYRDLELSDGQRLVCQNDAFLVVVPFWAVWPFETLVLSKRHLGAMHELDDRERDQLADVLRQTTAQYDRVFETPFPYSMGFHQPPLHDPAPERWHFHAHFYPPLLRSATIRKHMVGFELPGSPQRDVNPEDAAARLREVAEGR